MLPSFVSAAALSLSAAAFTCQAATIYTNRAAWQLSVGSFTIETFDRRIPDEPFPNDLVIVFDNGTVSTGIGGTAQNGVFSGIFSGDIDTSGDFAFLFDSIRWTFPFPLIGFGADLQNAADGTGLLFTGNFDGTGPQSISVLAALGDPGVGFLGVIGTSPFTSVTLTEEFALRNGIGAEGFALDNLSLAAAPVPEPGTYALLAFGLTLIGALRTGKR